MMVLMICQTIWQYVLLPVSSVFVCDLSGFIVVVVVCAHTVLVCCPQLDMYICWTVVNRKDYYINLKKVNSSQFTELFQLSVAFINYYNGLYSV